MQNEKNPLGPPEIVDIRCCEFAIPIVTETQYFQLSAEIGDIVFGGNARRGVGADCMLFRGKAKRVESHRMQN